MKRYNMLNAMTIFFLIMGMVITTLVGDDLAILPFVFCSFLGSIVCHEEAQKEWKEIKDNASMDRPE